MFRIAQMTTGGLPPGSPTENLRSGPEPAFPCQAKAWDLTVVPLGLLADDHYIGDVLGANRKNRGKPCSVAAIEAVFQLVFPANHSPEPTLPIRATMVGLTDSPDRNADLQRAMTEPYRVDKVFKNWQPLGQAIQRSGCASPRPSLVAGPGIEMPRKDVPRR